MFERQTQPVGSEFRPENRYGLSDEEIDEIIDQSNIKVKPNKTTIIRVTDSMGDLANVARTLELRNFREAFGDTPEGMVELYGDHELASRFYLAVTADRGQGNRVVKKPIGVLRAIEGAISGSVTAQTIPPEAMQDSFDLSRIFEGRVIPPETKVWDIGTVAVDKNYRKSNKGKENVGMVGLQVYRALYWDMAEEQVDYMTAMMDYRLLGRLKKIGVPMRHFHGVEQEFEYSGSERTSALIGYVPDFRIAVTKESIIRREIASIAALLILSAGVIDRPRNY